MPQSPPNPFDPQALFFLGGFNNVLTYDYTVALVREKLANVLRALPFLGPAFVVPHWAARAALLFRAALHASRRDSQRTSPSGKRRKSCPPNSTAAPGTAVTVWW